ncbi:hypothetical protein ACFQ1I_16925 [Kitasatospora arboriphila]
MDGEPVGDVDYARIRHAWETVLADPELLRPSPSRSRSAVPPPAPTPPRPGTCRAAAAGTTC